MGIRLFLYLLISLSIFFLLFTIVFDKQKETKPNNMPKVSFIDSTMYQLNDKQVAQIIQAKRAEHYDDHDVLLDGAIVMRTDNSNNSDSTQTISAKYINKTDNILTLKDNVVVNQNNVYVLNTNYLHYNAKTKIGTNNHPFKFDYLNNTLTGNQLYFDSIYNIIKSKNANFVLNIEQKD